MARYLLIEFDNNDQADALRAQIDTATRKGKAFRVVGLFARPGKNCQCAAESRPTFVEWVTKKARPVMGSKLGLWICPVCKRPRFGNQQPINLLARDEIVDPTVFMEYSWLDMPPRRRGWQYYPQGISLWCDPAKED